MARKDKPTAAAPKEVGAEVHAGETAPRLESRIEPLRREVDRLFDLVQNLEWRLPWGAGGVEVRTRTPDWKLVPAINFAESAEAYTITAELPGLAQEDVEVKVAANVLTIRGEKTEENTVQAQDYHLSERRFGRFQRSFRLPEDADAEGIEARMDRGVLTVTVPKSAAARESERRIEIRTG